MGKAQRKGQRKKKERIPTEKKDAYCRGVQENGKREEAEAGCKEEITSSQNQS